MAKLEFNSASLLPHGIMGKLLLRRWGNKVLIGPVPDYSKRKASAKQKMRRRLFQQDWAPAARRLLADPKERAACQRLAEEKHWPLWNAAISRASKMPG